VLNRRSTAALLGRVEFALMKALAMFENGDGKISNLKALDVLMLGPAEIITIEETKVCLPNESR
jgi:hypothetical protein